MGSVRTFGCPGHISSYFADGAGPSRIATVGAAIHCFLILFILILLIFIISINTILIIIRVYSVPVDKETRILST